MLISPTEPQRLRELGKTSSIPENFGADILIVAGKSRIGVQRKKFPDDFVASLSDGRLYKQLPMLAKLEGAFIVFEGRGKWTEDGDLISQDFGNLSRQQMYGVVFSAMMEFGVPTFTVKNMNETIELLEYLDAWAHKDKHMSLKRRHGPKKNGWGKISARAQAQHILQGFPGVGPDIADRMIEHFGTVPLTWTHAIDELMEVPGVGKRKAQLMVEALDVVTEDG